jgi:hypothetical protein
VSSGKVHLLRASSRKGGYHLEMEVCHLERADIIWIGIIWERVSTGGIIMKVRCMQYSII